MVNTLRRAAGMMVDDTLTSKIHQKFTFSQFERCIANYYRNMSAGKWILKPHALDQKLAEGSEFPEFDIKDLAS